MAARRLEAGTRVSYGGSEFTVGHTVLEGHRFAVEPIAEGEDLLSWGLRFGRATRDIAPGDYACNEKILRVLRERLRVSPERGEDEDPEGTSDQGGGRVGTRNHIAVMGVTSRLTGFVRALELEMNGVADVYENVDGIVCVAHTEGGEERTPNNLDLLLRTLSGFMVNPNVGAALV